MEAKEFDPETGELRFEFLDITNLSSPGAPHMHDVKFQFVELGNVRKAGSTNPPSTSN